MIIDIVTPTYNRDRFLAETLESVSTQKINGKINYYLMDGGSTDNTIDIAKTWQARAQVENSHLTIDIEIGKDKGMYDAIFKGFNKGSGEIMAWINSDDIYLPKAFSVAENIFEKFPDIDWICGIPCIMNAQGSIIRAKTAFPLKSRDGIKRGIYNFKNKGTLCPCIQQDCVFWRRSLWDKLTPEFIDLFRSAKYAGDHFLWKEFSKHTKMYHIECILSCFRIHGSQLTTDLSGYEKEMGQEKPKLKDILISAMLNIPYLAPKIFRSNFIKNKHANFCINSGAGLIAWDRTVEDWIKKY